MTGEGIKTKPVGDVGGELRDLGGKPAPHLTLMRTLGCAHTHTLIREV